MDSIESQIIHALSKEHRSVMITDIAKITGLNRHTVARRLDILEILGKVRKIQIGNAKRYRLADSLPICSLVDISSELNFLCPVRLKLFLPARSLLQTKLSIRMVIHPAPGHGELSVPGGLR